MSESQTLLTGVEGQGQGMEKQGQGNEQPKSKK
jgi:hypothetical protein